jgi:voltage-gated potassium channel Kch
MNAFATAIAALFADPNITVEAIYTPAGGDPMTVRVIAKRPDGIVGFGHTRIHTATTMFDVRVSEVSAPADGDTLEIGGETYVIQGEPVRDRDGLMWSLDTHPA